MMLIVEKAKDTLNPELLQVGQILYLLDTPMVYVTRTSNSIKTVRIWNQEQIFEEWKLGVLSIRPKG